MAAGVSVKGLNQTIGKLRKFGVEAADLKDSMHRVGEIVAHEVKALAPVRTGALRASVRTGKAQRKAIVRAGGARVQQALFQNYGYKGIAGRHFMERAAEAKRGQVVQQLDTEISGLIRKYGL